MSTTNLNHFLTTSLHLQSNTQTMQVLEALEQRIGTSLQGATYLGKGAHAEVYWLKDRKKVLKITIDPSDAEASIVVQHKPDPSLVHVYDVCQITTPATRRTCYSLVVEKLTPLSPIAAARIKAYENIFFGLFYHFPTMKQIESPAYQKIIGITPEETEQYKIWAKALDARHIIWYDLQTANIMMRGHTKVISDLGASETMGGPKIPQVLVEF